MQNVIFLFSALALFVSINCFSQEEEKQVVVNKHVKVVEYDYKCVYVDFFSEAGFSVSYPIITIGQPSENQQFFEQGRNIRPGYEFGFSQGVKAGCWAIDAGIYFQHYGELLSYYEYATRQVTIQEADGTLTPIQVTDGDPRLLSYNNSLGYLKIPLEVSYYPELLRNKLGFSLGGNLHYLLTADYMTKYSASTQAGLLNKNDFNTTCFSLSGTISWYWNFDKNFSLKLEPYADFWLQNLIDKQDITFGVNILGIRISVLGRY